MRRFEMFSGDEQKKIWRQPQPPVRRLYLCFNRCIRIDFLLRPGWHRSKEKQKEREYKGGRMANATHAVFRQVLGHDLVFLSLSEARRKTAEERPLHFSRNSNTPKADGTWKLGFGD